MCSFKFFDSVNNGLFVQHVVTNQEMDHDTSAGLSVLLSRSPKRGPHTNTGARVLGTAGSLSPSQGQGASGLAILTQHTQQTQQQLEDATSNDNGIGTVKGARLVSVYSPKKLLPTLSLSQSLPLSRSQTNTTVQHSPQPRGSISNSLNLNNSQHASAAPLRTLVAKELKQAKHESNKARRQRVKARYVADNPSKRLFEDKIISNHDTLDITPKKPRITKTLQSNSLKTKTTTNSPTVRSKPSRLITITQAQTQPTSSPSKYQTGTSPVEPTIQKSRSRSPNSMRRATETPNTESRIENSYTFTTSTSTSTTTTTTSTIPLASSASSTTSAISHIASFSPAAKVSVASEATTDSNLNKTENKEDNTYTFLEVNYTSELEKWRFDLLKEEQELREELYHKQVAEWKAETKVFEEEILEKLRPLQHATIRGEEPDVTSYITIPPKFWEEINEVRELRNNIEKETNLSRYYYKLRRKLDDSPALTCDIDIMAENEYDVASHKFQAIASFPSNKFSTATTTTTTTTNLPRSPTPSIYVPGVRASPSLRRRHRDGSFSASPNNKLLSKLAHRLSASFTDEEKENLQFLSWDEADNFLTSSMSDSDELFLSFTSSSHEDSSEDSM